LVKIDGERRKSVRLEDHTVGRGAAIAAIRTLPHQRGNGLFEPLKLGKPEAQLEEADFGQRPRLRAGLAQLQQRQQGADFGNREIEFAATADKSEPVNVLIVEAPLRPVSRGRAKQPNLLVIADGRHRRPGALRQCPDPQRPPPILRLNLNWLQGVSVAAHRNNVRENHMSVIEPSCSLGSETSPPCACARKAKAAAGIAGAASLTALAAAACTGCCILPFTLPAAVLAVAGSSIALLDHAHVWVSRLAIAVVAGAWFWIGWQAWRRGRRVARTTLAMMILASLLAGAAASWPLLEPQVFSAMGIVKKKVSQGE
jgi:hypothetical protein